MMKTKIILFEDEDSVRDLILEILADSGYDAVSLDPNENLLGNMISIRPDLIISDIMMPGKSGIDVFTEIKGNDETQSIPFIFLTAKSEYTDIRLGMSIGADDYILKPFKARDLLRSIELRLIKSKKLKERLQDFSTNVALHLPHELRTPLIALLGYSDIIIEDYDNLSDNEILDCVKSIRKSSQRLHKVIEKFILYSDILSTELNNCSTDRFLSNNWIDISCVINISSLNIAVLFGRTEDLEIRLEPYESKITEESILIIISQIVENALKYSRPGTKVEIKGEKVNSRYMISIKDNGAGMTKAQIANLFPMQQFNRGMFNMSGNGLGLAIVQKILSFIGSDLKINSEPNCGTIVSFEIKK
jgi:two-component system, sensor histidine kinase and response regulator